jgi:hypothetical protein
MVDCPEEEIAKNIWLLLRMGFDRGALIAALGLLKSSSHSALTTEQAHCAGAVMTKAHKMYGDATMRERSWVYQLRALLTTNPLESKLKELWARLEKVRSRNPNRLGAKQAFLSDLLNMASARRREGRVQNNFPSKHLISSHGKHWASMSAQMHAAWGCRAEDRREDHREKNEADVVALVSHIAGLKQQLREDAATDGVLRCSSCLLSDQEKTQLVEFIRTYPLTDAQIAAQRTLSCREMGPSPEHVRDTLSNFEVQSLPLGSFRTPWAGAVAKHRSFYASCVFRFGGHGSEHTFAFMLCRTRFFVALFECAQRMWQSLVCTTASLPCTMRSCTPSTIVS